MVTNDSKPTTNAPEERYVQKIKEVFKRTDLSEQQRRKLVEIYRAGHNLETLADLFKKIGTDYVGTSLGNSMPSHLAEIASYLHESEETVLQYGGTWEKTGSGVTRRVEDGKIRTGGI